jgi:glutamate formiminotransferase/formiminotetrahydrofolate cyclodeaminase
MVANLSASKSGWEERWEEFSSWAEKGQILRKQLLGLVDEDTRSFNAIMQAFQLPKGNEKEISARKQAIQDATRYAIEVPVKVMELSLESMQIMKAMAEKGNQNSITDAGVGALCALTGVSGAFMNVKINCASYNDKAFTAAVIEKGNSIEQRARQMEKEVMELITKAVG